MLILLLILCLTSALIVYTNFGNFILNGVNRISNVGMSISAIIHLIMLPLFYAGFGNGNRCCVDDEIDTAAFAQNHQLTIMVIIAIALLAYGYSLLRSRISPPVIEVLLNSSLLIGLALSIIITIHAYDKTYAILGSIPITLLFLMMLAINHSLFMNDEKEMQELNQIERLAWRLLNSKSFIKYPILIVLCLPLIVLIVSILTLFGQKPDSVVRAFTETYRHGLSQWDYKCDNIDCGGHYLCSVAAKGHPRIVRPQRFGVRSGGLIICNRQLLIANAFEEIVQERFPLFHATVRRNYNMVGNLIHRYYSIFDNKYISDIIYLFMKPVEWCFLIVLYCLDTKPENRIAKQYIYPLTKKS